MDLHLYAISGGIILAINENVGLTVGLPKGVGILHFFRLPNVIVHNTYLIFEYIL